MSTSTALLPGRATPEGTAAYAARLSHTTSHDHFRSFAFPGVGALTLSSVGLGTYLGHDDAPTDEMYEAAVVRALELGCNVLDSAINYRSQRSERSVGAAVRRAVAGGLVRREEVVVATKGGYVPFDGSRPRNYHSFVEETYVRPGIFRHDELVEGCHCMSPRYLEDQLERSRNNLGLQTIDIYYLHNPETQLDAVARADFLERSRSAFTFLERACQDGRIGVYGTATWSGYRQVLDAPQALHLDELVRIARDIAGDQHHFRVLQLPVNLAMPEAYTLPNQRLRGEADSPATLLEAAAAEGLYVMASASVLQGRLTRSLQPALRDLVSGDTDAQRAIQVVRSMPGVGTALVGMKQVAHVEENLAVAGLPQLAPEVVARLFNASATH